MQANKLAENHLDSHADSGLFSPARSDVTGVTVSGGDALTSVSSSAGHDRTDHTLGESGNAGSTVTTTTGAANNAKTDIVGTANAINAAASYAGAQTTGGKNADTKVGVDAKSNAGAALSGVEALTTAHTGAATSNLVAKATSGNDLTHDGDDEGAEALAHGVTVSDLHVAGSSTKAIAHSADDMGECTRLVHVHLIKHGLWGVPAVWVGGWGGHLQ